MPKITFVTSEKSVRTKNNKKGLWTIAELIMFSIRTKAKILFTDCGIEIDRGELKKIN
jgi:hypothetical protein